jgi:hypothetical protein
MVLSDPSEHAVLGARTSEFSVAAILALSPISIEVKSKRTSSGRLNGIIDLWGGILSANRGLPKKRKDFA